MTMWITNYKERYYCNRDPVRCAIRSYAAALAWNRVFWDKGQRQNALRHCVWTCLMTVLLNEGQALHWGNVHEYYDPDRTWYDMEVDLRNNYVGRLFGRQLRYGAWVPLSYWAYYFCSGAWDRGWLWVWDRKQGRIETSLGTLAPRSMHGR